MPYKQAKEQARTLLLDYVGPEYDQGTLPRVLFLSLDPGSSLPTPADRTIAALQRDESTCNVYLLPRGRHWYETHELALILLQPFDPMLPLQGICRYFAHANSAKCCANNPGRRQGSWQMFEKCKGYVPGEIAALRPAILVTQGQAARLAVRAQFQVLRPLSQPSCEAALIDVDGRAVIWLAMSHPRNGAYWAEKRAGTALWPRIVTTHLPAP